MKHANVIPDVPLPDSYCTCIMRGSPPRIPDNACPKEIQFIIVKAGKIPGERKEIIRTGMLPDTFQTSIQFRVGCHTETVDRHGFRVKIRARSGHIP